MDAAATLSHYPASAYSVVGMDRSTEGVRQPVTHAREDGLLDRHERRRVRERSSGSIDLSTYSKSMPIVASVREAIRIA